MASTHLSLHFHVVFSTKNREPRIAAAWREEEYLELLHRCGVDFDERYRW